MIINFEEKFLIVCLRKPIDSFDNQISLDIPQ